MAANIEREEFEAVLRKPPHFARMLEHAGHFVGRMSKIDREALLEMAWERLWNQRGKIHETKDILIQWIAALMFAAKTRKTWLVYYNIGGWRRVRNHQLGRDE